MGGGVSTLQGSQAMLRPDVTSSVPAPDSGVAELERDLLSGCPALDRMQKGN